MSDDSLSPFTPAGSMYYHRDGSPMSREQMLEPEVWSDESRRVGYDEVVFAGHRFDISTVHLVIDHNFLGIGPPLIFETMIFQHGSSHDQYTERYSTQEQARERHEFIVDQLRTGIINPFFPDAIES